MLDKHFKYSASNEKVGNVLYLVACKESTSFGLFTASESVSIGVLGYFPGQRR